MEGALATPGAWAGAAMAGGYLAEATPSPSGPGGETVDIPCCGTEFIMYLCLCTALVIFAALMAGLTMALMSLDAMNISIIEASGTERERGYARAIGPLIKNKHLLLVTLLIGNATAMEALPIFLDRLVPGYLAIIMSVTLVLCFGEILPQAVFTKYRLPIGAYLSSFVIALEVVLFPIAYPIALLLDAFLGKDHPTIYRRAELKELTRQHLIDSEGQGTLTMDEVKIMRGTLDMADKTAKDAMHPIMGTFMLEADAHLDEECMAEIMESGHSRIPIYMGTRANVAGLLITKNLILVDPTGGTKVRDVSKFAIRKMPRVAASLPLFELLHFFGQGRAHLALVCNEDGLTPVDIAEVLGIITMEDVIEELIQEEIQDEADTSSQAVSSLAQSFYRKNRKETVHRGRAQAGSKSQLKAGSTATLTCPLIAADEDGFDETERLLARPQAAAGRGETSPPKQGGKAGVATWSTLTLSQYARDKGPASLSKTRAQSFSANSGSGEGAPSLPPPAGSSLKLLPRKVPGGGSMTISGGDDKASSGKARAAAAQRERHESEKAHPPDTAVKPPDAPPS